MANEKTKTSSLDSSFPCLLPEDPALTFSNDAFEQHVRQLVCKAQDEQGTDLLQETVNNLTIDTPTDESFIMLRQTSHDSPGSVIQSERTGDPTTSETRHVEPTSGTNNQRTTFIAAPSSTPGTPTSEFKVDMGDKMLTENHDMAFSTTKSPLLDLFQELETVISGPRARELLEAAWLEDSTVTLKIIWNARSIHLGKGDRTTFYRCLGWLVKYHPLTLLFNLNWIYLWTIEKKAPKKDSENDVVMVNDPKSTDTKIDQMTESSDEQWLVKNGGAHGYFKDLLNILVLHLHGALDVLSHPRNVLNIENTPNLKRKHPSLENVQDLWDKEKARDKRHTLETDRHRKVLSRLRDDSIYKALHLTVARLFASQLESDLELLAGDERSKNQISLAAKWAPSLEKFHDKHTNIATSISEILFPKSKLCPNVTDATPRTEYLRCARETFRAKVLSPLRAQLALVERNICNETFEKIDYSHVPSLAMNRYGRIFASKDTERFATYLRDVSTGKQQISGAVLMPSTLVKQAFEGNEMPNFLTNRKGLGSKRSQIGRKKLAEKMRSMQNQVINGQWNSLVQRIKESGNFRSAIAVCDVSGSMQSPKFADGTCPMHSSLGLSLLLAEITDPPYGGGFITFSQKPVLQLVGGPQDERTLSEKLNSMASSHWDMNTDFVAVFEDLILPMALEKKIPPEDMVKTVFVFSDMQFDSAQTSWSRWNKSSYERIQKAYKDAGYEMPDLVFWNLAGGRGGYGGLSGDSRAPKPVDAKEARATLVSGYSQAQLKMFMEEGVFGEKEPELEAREGVDEGFMDVRKKKMNPLDMMRKAIDHPAYQMLKVYD